MLRNTVSDKYAARREGEVDAQLAGEPADGGGGVGLGLVEERMEGGRGRRPAGAGRKIARRLPRIASAPLADNLERARVPQDYAPLNGEARESMVARNTQRADRRATGSHHRAG